MQLTLYEMVFAAQSVLRFGSKAALAPAQVAVKRKDRSVGQTTNQSVCALLEIE
jgi:hypothetical protein